MNPELDPLLGWYWQNRRSLPWRGSSDPYAVWMSEAMLQQTTVKAVIPFYKRWMKRFPTVEALASASEEEVLQYWAGLGYYRRARNLQAGAKQILMSGFPNSAKDWQAVPGIGAYTAGAISSIAQGQAEALVDGNVERVFARLEASNATGRNLKNEAWRWAETELRRDAPGDWNQALMELGATVCTPLNPKCEVCPVSRACRAFKTGSQMIFPGKKLRPAMESLNLYVSVHFQEDQVALRQARSDEWWAGLWVLPYQRIPRIADESFALPSVKGVVTKHKITYRSFYDLTPIEGIDATLFGLDEVETMAIPKAFRKIIHLGVQKAFTRRLF